MAKLRDAFYSAGSRILDQQGQRNGVYRVWATPPYDRVMRWELSGWLNSQMAPGTQLEIIWMEQAEWEFVQSTKGI